MQKKSCFISIQPSALPNQAARIAADSLSRLKQITGNEVELYVWGNTDAFTFASASSLRPGEAGVGSEIMGSVIQQLEDLRRLDRMQKEGLLCPNCQTEQHADHCTDCEEKAEHAQFVELSLKPDEHKDYQAKLIEQLLPRAVAGEQLSGLIGEPALRLAAVRDGCVMATPWFREFCDVLHACGYGSDENRFTRVWPTAVLFVSKSWLHTTGLAWTIALSALDIALPRWAVYGDIIFTRNENEPVECTELARNYGDDGLRFFYLQQKVALAQLSVPEEQLIQKINQYLANNLGNVVARVASLITRYADGIVPRPNVLTRQTGDLELREMALSVPRQVEASIEQQDLPGAVATVWRLIAQLNKYIEETSPWQMEGQTDSERLHTVLYSLGEALRFIGVVLKPLMPEAAGKILSQLGIGGSVELQSWSSLAQWGQLRPGTRVQQTPPLFPRIQPLNTRLAEDQVHILREDLSRVSFIVVRVVSAQRIAAERMSLVVFDGHMRRKVIIPAGRFTPGQLVGKKLVYVANLINLEIDGETSEGEVLFSEAGDGMPSLITVEEDIPEGSKIYAGLN